MIGVEGLGIGEIVEKGKQNESAVSFMVDNILESY